MVAVLLGRLPSSRALCLSTAMSRVSSRASSSSLPESSFSSPFSSSSVSVSESLCSRPSVSISWSSSSSVSPSCSECPQISKTWSISSSSKYRRSLRLIVLPSTAESSEPVEQDSQECPVLDSRCSVFRNC